MTHAEPNSSPVAEAAVASASRRGTPLVIAGHLASQLIGVGTLAVLYRLLEPEDYGLLAAVLPAVMLPRMAATLGPGVAVLQRRDLSHTQLSVLFWLQVFVGVAATFLSVGICCLLAWKYRQQMLFPVGVALASGTLFAAIGNQHQALLERELRFGTASLLRLVAQFIACATAIGWAVWRPDVWSLVLQHVVELFVLVIGSWLLMSWRPSWPARPWHVRELIPFSAAYSASSLVHFLSQNIEKILLPMFFGEAGNRALGLYSQAFGLMIKPVYLLTTPLTGVMVSSLAKAPVGSEFYAQLTAKFFRFSALGLFPCAIGLALVSDEVMLLLGGEEWRDGSGLLRWLAPSIITIGLQNLAIFVLASRGMGRALLIASAWLLLLILQGAAFGMYAGQIWSPANEEPALRASFGLAVAFTLVQFFVWGGPFLWFALRSVGVSPVAIAWNIWPAARAAALMGLLVFGVKTLLNASDVESSTLRLFAMVLTGMISYCLLTARELRHALAVQKN
jgi:O-antigen/teichoic acid export membrane protein